MEYESSSLHFPYKTLDKSEITYYQEQVFPLMLGVQKPSMIVTSMVL